MPRRHFLRTLAGVSVGAAHASALENGSKVSPEYFDHEAWKVIRSLPADPESPARSVAFFRHLQDHLQHPNGVNIAKHVYVLAATGHWPVLQQDIPMLLQAVLCNPTLLPIVAPSIGIILSPFPSGTGIRKTWRHVRVCCHWKEVNH